jgi:hypothetical protein
MSGELVTLAIRLDPSWREAARPAEDAGAYARRTVAAAARGTAIVSAQVKRRSARRREPLDQGAMIGKLIEALSAKAAGGDLDPLIALRRLSGQLDTAMTAAAVEARRAGHSWTTIAGELGVSRQAARQRWGRAAADAGLDVEAEQ